MLEELRIRGLGVIEDALLTLSPGLTVVTGETGAGKTMIVTSIGLLLGQRADPALVRSDVAAVVEGRVVLPAEHRAIQRALEAGAELDDGALLLARTISSEGRSRAHVGGRSVPAGLLAEMGDDLIAVHGQSDQQLLRRPGAQRAALDRFAGEAVAGPLTAYRRAYERHRELTARIEALVSSARERAQEADLLRFGLAEIEAVQPQPGEDATVARELARLEHVEALRQAAELARAALAGDPDETGPGGASAATGAGTARAALEHGSGLDATLDQLGQRAAALTYEIDDLAAELAAYARGLDDDPLRLAELQDRRAVLSRLGRKYGGSADEVLAWSRDAAKRLVELDGDDDSVALLQEEQGGLLGELARFASALTIARTAAAERLGTAVTAELADLAMAGPSLQVAVAQNDDPAGLSVVDRVLAYGRHGVDTVELLLEAHPGAPPRPLQKGASGGELSRVMLAVEVVFAGADPVPTFVFDEVDAGVGGRAAVGVGARLARLARTAQVIVVTHLPQVAAFADAHFIVRKSAAGPVTRSGVEELDDAGRERELSRMLAGLEDSELARAHAAELLAVAAEQKAG